MVRGLKTHVVFHKERKKRACAICCFPPWSSSCDITKIGPVGLFIDSGPYKETAEGTERLFLPGREENSRSHTDKAGFKKLLEC